MRGTRERLSPFLAVAVALTLVAGACGGGDDAAEDGDGTDTTEGADTGGVAAEPGPGFDGSTIRVGLIVPVTGPGVVVGTPLTDGAKVYFDHVNDELGGVAGRYQVEVVTADDPTPPATTVQAYTSIKDDVVMIGQVVNTPATNAVLPLLERDGLVAATAHLDSAFLREQHILTTGAPYEIQAINAMSYWQDHGGEGQSACVAYVDEPYFEVGLDGVEYAADQMGFDVAEVVPIEPGSQDWATPIQALEGCDMVYLASTAIEAGGLVGAAAMAGFTPQWIGQAPTFGKSLVAGPLGDYLREHFWVAAEGPAWGDESVAGMAQMLRHVQRYAPDQQPDPVFSLGYARAWAVHQVLEKAVELGDLSRPGIVEAMNSIDTLEFGGLVGDYRYGLPDDRDPPRGSTIFQVDPEVPGGLSALSDVNYASDAARSYRFEP